MVRSTAPLLLAAAAAILLLARFAGAGRQEAEVPLAQRVVVVQAPTPEPTWDTVTVRDETAAELLTVPLGKRFVLTDMWLFPMEEETAGLHPMDRIWLENRHDGKSYIVFDTYAKMLEVPVRWNTGVSFDEGTEVWFYWDFDPSQRRVRRVHYTGYFEVLSETTPASAR